MKLINLIVSPPIADTIDMIGMKSKFTNWFFISACTCSVKYINWFKCHIKRLLIDKIIFASEPLEQPLNCIYFSKKLVKK